MAIPRSPRFQFLCAALLQLLMISVQVSSYKYKVGDLDAWGIPTESNSQVYAQWSKYHSLKLGDSLLFLYPPSQDSVVQVSQQAYDACNVTDPILYMNNGNSLFNVTSPGVFYFTSGTPGNCDKKQKLQISVLSGNGSASSPSAGGPSALPDISPSYPTVFGSIPAGQSSAHSRGIPPALAVMAVGLLAYAATGGGGGRFM